MSVNAIVGMLPAGLAGVSPGSGMRAIFYGQHGMPEKPKLLIFSGLPEIWESMLRLEAGL